MDFYVPFFKYPRIVEFEDVRSWRVINPDRNLKTGDILLFSASGFMSSVIKLFTRSRWNHIGMVCWCEIKYIDGSTKEDLYCFELGSQPFTDLMTRKYIHLEVRLVRLADISRMYDIIAVRKLNYERGPDWAEKFQTFMFKWKSTPYFPMHTLLKAVFIKPGAPNGKTTCCDIAAKMMDELKVHDLKFDSSQLCPDDFAGHSTAFPKEIFKGPEIVIYKDHKLMNARLIFIIIVVFILIVLLICVIKRSRKDARAKAKTTQATQSK